jgi:hypothetical protein
MSIFRRIIILIALLLILLFCLSCAGTVDKAPIPPYIKDLADNNALNVETPIVKANLYFDNTQSMYGFITRGQVSNFVITMDALLSMIGGYKNYSLNALRPDDRNILAWQDLSLAAAFNYRSKDFYTYKGVFEKREEGTGPLQLLFGDNSSIVNFDEINIFTTDLAEQNMRNIVLARKLNEIVLEREDYAILIYCINSNFNGMAAVPLQGVVSTSGQRLTMAVDNSFSGERPFYLIVTGPTIEVFKLNDDVSSGLDSAGLIENEDYFRSLVMPQRGLQKSPIVQLITLEMIADTPTYKGIRLDISNRNYNFLSVKYEDIFLDIDSILPGLNFVFTNQYNPVKEDRNNGLINLVLPLTDLADKSLADKASYWIASDLIQVWGGKFVTSANDENDNQENKYYYPDMGFIWEEIDSFNYNRHLDIDIELVKKDSVIYELTYVSPELEKQGYEETVLYSVESNSGALNIKMYLNNIDQISDEYISVLIPIYGKIEKGSSIPEWILNYNLSSRNPFNPDNPSATPEYFMKTDGLIEFYEVLLGNYTSAVETEHFEKQMEKKIADVVINVRIK